MLIVEIEIKPRLDLGSEIELRLVALHVEIQFDITGNTIGDSACFQIEPMQGVFGSGLFIAVIKRGVLNADMSNIELELFRFPGFRLRAFGPAFLRHTQQIIHIGAAILEAYQIQAHPPDHDLVHHHLLAEQRQEFERNAGVFYRDEFLVAFVFA